MHVQLTAVVDSALLRLSNSDQKWSPELPNIRILKSKILGSYDKHDVFVFHTVS